MHMKLNLLYANRLNIWIIAAALMLPAGGAEAATHVVQFGGSFGFAFSPASFTAAVGDTVKWEVDFTMHPLSSTTIPANAASWHVTSGTSFIYVISVPGSYGYQCDLHSSFGMVGSFQAAGSGVRFSNSFPSANETGRSDRIIVQSAGNYALKFFIPRVERISAWLVDLRGRERPIFVDRMFAAGIYTVSLDREIQTNGFNAVRIQGHNSGGLALINAY
jgi:plastocyanin